MASGLNNNVYIENKVFNNNDNNNNNNNHSHPGKSVSTSKWTHLGRWASSPSWGGEGGRPAFGLVPIPNPDFPPYTVRTTHLHGAPDFG